MERYSSGEGEDDANMLHCDGSLHLHTTLKMMKKLLKMKRKGS